MSLNTPFSASVAHRTSIGSVLRMMFSAAVRRPRQVTVRRILSAGAVLLAAGCTTMAEPEGPLRQENVFAVTASNRLIQFNAGQPARLLGNRPLTGLAADDRILAIDYRVARGLLYALGASGQLYIIDTAIATVRKVGSGLQQPALASGDLGFDFNPTVDRIRLISGGRVNARIHPDTGLLVDAHPNQPELQLDGTLAYATGDVNAGKQPRVAAAAYTYNKVDEKITTNYAVDADAGVLVTQGTREGVQPPVSPNSGQLFTVGRLNAGPIGRISFDIADLNNAAFTAVTAPGGSRSGLFLLDLETGSARRLGTIGGDEPVVGIAIEP